ncbi:unnamed protein product [Schistosoma spindalis]|nr:unnamed protein product [Schistosoma spindale]
MSHHYSMQSQYLSSSSSSSITSSALLTDRSNITHPNTDLIMGNTVPSSFLEMNLTQTTNGLLNNNNNISNNDVDLNRQTRVNLTDDNAQCKSPLWVPPVTPYTLLGLLKPHLTQSGLLTNNNTTHQIQQQTSTGTLINTKLCEDSIGHQPFQQQQQQQQQSSLKQSQHQISSMSAYLSELLNQSQTSIATTTTSGKNSVHALYEKILIGELDQLHKSLEQRCLLSNTFDSNQLMTISCSEDNVSSGVNGRENTNSTIITPATPVTTNPSSSLSLTTITGLKIGNNPTLGTNLPALTTDPARALLIAGQVCDWPGCGAILGPDTSFIDQSQYMYYVVSNSDVSSY